MRDALATARRWLDLTLGRAPAEGEAQLRFTGIVRGAATALLARAVGVGVGFAVVPLSVGYLGAERYGAWITISSCIAWFQLADLGLLNGLTNAMAEARGKGQDAAVREHVATAFWALVAISGGIAAVSLVAWPFIDWAAILNVTTSPAQDEMGPAVGVAGALFLASFPLMLVDRIYAVHHEGATGNAWAIAGSLASLAAVVLVTRTAGGLVGIAAATTGATTLALVANAAWLFGGHRPELRPAPRLVRGSSLRRLGGEGLQFFAVQLIAVVMFSTDNVIIARVLGPEHVTPYSVAWRLFTLPTLFVGLYAPYLQPGYAAARARGDVRWVARAVTASAVASFIVAAVSALPLVAYGRPLIRWWAGDVAVPSMGLLAWMGAWAVILAPATALACMLNGLGRLRVQIVLGGLAAATNVALSVVLARRYGVEGVMAATVVSYAVCLVVPATLDGVRAIGDLRPSGGAR